MIVEGVLYPPDGPPQRVSWYLGEVNLSELAARGAAPGPLVSHFSAAAGNLPCPLYIIPADYDETKSEH